jgi:hypothetical protein
MLIKHEAKLAEEKIHTHTHRAEERFPPPTVVFSIQKQEICDNRRCATCGCQHSNHGKKNMYIVVDFVKTEYSYMITVPHGNIPLNKKLCKDMYHGGLGI